MIVSESGNLAETRAAAANGLIIMCERAYRPHLCAAASQSLRCLCSTHECAPPPLTLQPKGSALRRPQQRRPACFPPHPRLCSAAASAAHGHLFCRTSRPAISSAQTDMLFYQVNPITPRLQRESGRNATAKRSPALCSRHSAPPRLRHQVRDDHRWRRRGHSLGPAQLGGKEGVKGNVDARGA